ncbi:MAG: D-alanyl-D-alanine carboxypeptidase/D-alanyl-D-alanine-endopeptidase [Vicinamibacterales bacterium]
MNGWLWPMRAAVLVISAAAAHACASARGGKAGPPTDQAPLTASVAAVPSAPGSVAEDTALSSDLDSLLSSPLIAGALVAARVDSLIPRRTLYARNAQSLVMPASNMKIVTMAVAAERLGWDARFETRLEATGTIDDGVLNGDLIAVGTGDPAITAPATGTPSLFSEWSAALRRAGIHRVHGRLVGDDDAFEEEGLGAGWAWDYLAAGYAAPSGALSYNENVAVLRIAPGPSIGAPARLEVGPPGHGLQVVNRLSTGAADVMPAIALARLPGNDRLTVTGAVPLGGSPLIRTAAVANPTQFFVEALRTSLLEQGVVIDGGAYDIDEVAPSSLAKDRRVIARRQSDPLSALVGYAMKVSQNFYAEMILKALGRAASGVGSVDAGRLAVRETITAWGLPVGGLVMYDGSGLSRYDYVTADLIVGVLERVWADERLRGPFAAALPVGGRDGTLQTRMSGPILNRRIQAKTGTISNVRALSGYAEDDRGGKLAFSFIVNNAVASGAQVDALVDRALERILTSPARASGTAR